MKISLLVLFVGTFDLVVTVYSSTSLCRYFALLCSAPPRLRFVGTSHCCAQYLLVVTLSVLRTAVFSTSSPSLVGLPGIEPGLNAPHALVLPVYYSPFLTAVLYYSLPSSTSLPYASCGYSSCRQAFVRRRSLRTANSDIFLPGLRDYSGRAKGAVSRGL